MDVSLLAGILAERLLAFTPGMDRAFFCIDRLGGGGERGQVRARRHRPRQDRLLRATASTASPWAPSRSTAATCSERLSSPLLPDCVAGAVQRPAGAGGGAARQHDVAGFFVEPIQGKGVHVPADDYLPQALALCRKHGTLFIADEIQTGMGRTGKFLACEHWGVDPDMVLLSKSLSGGFIPVGAVSTKQWIFVKLFDRMDRAMVHGSTFSKNDLGHGSRRSPTSGVIEDEKLVARAATLGDAILDDFRAFRDKYELVKDVRGKGLMIGIEFGAPRSLALKAAWGLLETAAARACSAR